MKIKASIIVVLLAISPLAIAEKNIAQCIDASGNMTFSDYLCITEERGDIPLLMTDKAIDQSIRARTPTVIKANAITSIRLNSATDEAVYQCSKQFVGYFRRKHPAIANVPDIEFTEVVEQFVKGPNVSISLSGNVEYLDDAYSVASNIECTVQRFTSTTEWLVGYRER